MGRPRAGHGWTSVTLANGKMLDLITDWSGRWITTGEAKQWPRCSRCRKPNNDEPFGSRLCSICYFYHNGMSAEEFWRIHNSGYDRAPYNIGHQWMMRAQAWSRVSSEMRKPRAPWRRLLKEQNAAM